MATTVYTAEVIELRNGETVTLRPLSIKNLRLFMKKFDEFQNVDNELASLDILFALAAIGLRDDLKEKVDDEDYMTEALDMPTINRIIKVCGGIDLENPKSLVTTETETPGTT